MPSRPHRLPMAAVLTALLLSGVLGGPLQPGGAAALAATSDKKQSEKDSETARMKAAVLQRYGRYEDERVQAYVNEVGQRVAAKSDRPDLQYVFTVTDSEEINAITLPDGSIYIHRGLLALLNSEAELAAVLGHEIGHVTGRHIAKQQAGSTLANAGGLLLGILTGHPELMSAAGLASGLALSGYSRQQESEADSLGLQFITRAGYPPEAMVDSMRIIESYENFRMKQAREEQQMPAGGGRGDLFAEHPDTDKRVRDLQAQVDKAGADPNLPTGRDRYLADIDGLTYGSSRAAGIVRGSRFYHGDLGITLAFPSSWKVENLPTKVVAFTANGDSFMAASAQAQPPNMPPKELLGRLTKGQSTLDSGPLEVSGASGYWAAIRSTGLPWGNQGPAYMAVVYYNNLAYIFEGATRQAAASAALEPIFLSTVKTFRRLRDNEYALAEPDHIRVVQAPPGASMQELARNSPLGKYAQDELRLLNSLYPSGEPAAGEKLKVVE